MQRPHQGGAGRQGLGAQRLGLTSREVGVCTAMMGQGGRCTRSVVGAWACFLSIQGAGATSPLWAAQWLTCWGLAP